MHVSYDRFTEAFLTKITEFELYQLEPDQRVEVVDGFMKRAISNFKHVCRCDLSTTGDDNARAFDVTVDEDHLEEIVDIVSEGMVVQWLKQYLNRQELLENVLNTRDFTTYSPAELLMRVGNAYKSAQGDYTQMIREYSFNHGDLTKLHL